MKTFTVIKGYCEGESNDALYVNGQLVHEWHEINVVELIETLRKNGVDIEIKSIGSVGNSPYFEDNHYNYHKNLSEIDDKYFDKEKNK